MLDAAGLGFDREGFLSVAAGVGGESLAEFGGVAQPAGGGEETVVIGRGDVATPAMLDR